MHAVVERRPRVPADVAPVTYRKKPTSTSEGHEVRKQAKMSKKRLLLGAAKTKEYGLQTPEKKRHKQNRRRHACIYTLSVVRKNNGPRCKDEEQGGNQAD